MATSGSIDHSVSRNNIIDDALMMVQAIGPDDSVPATWTTHAARQLNNVVKALGSKRIGLWARKTGYILPVSDTNNVVLGPSGGHATLSYTRTALAEDVLSGASTIEVDSITGISDGDYIGIEQDDGTVHWTTVNGTPSGVTVTLDDVTTDTCSEDGLVWVYQTKLQRPLRIINAYVSNFTDVSNPSDIEVEIVAKREYELQNAKATTGDPNILTYDPQLENGVCYFWPRFSGGRSIIVISFQRPFEDFDGASDTPDFPQEAYDMLVYQLAVRLAPVYGMPSADRAQLLNEASMAMNLFLENEPEEGSFKLQPDMR